jgi:hypothetical protein
LKDIEDELKGWQDELSNLRRVQPMAGIVEDLKSDGIPNLVKQVQEETAKLEQAQDEVEEVGRILRIGRRDTDACRPNPKSPERRMWSEILVI